MNCRFTGLFKVQVFISVLAIAGCVSRVNETESGDEPHTVSVVQDGGWSRYRRVKNDGTVEPYAIAVKDRTGEVCFESHETPTLVQTAEYADEIFRQRLLPKLKSGEDLTDGELTALACCLNVRISLLGARNKLLLESMQLSEDSLTHGMVVHPRSNLPSDFGSWNERRKAENSRKSAEETFNRKLDDLVQKELQADTRYKDSVSRWGATFTGDESFTLDLDARREILRSILKGEDIQCDYLRDVVAKQLRRMGSGSVVVGGIVYWVGFPVCETIRIIDAVKSKNRELPDYDSKYRQRNDNTAWRGSYASSRHNLDVMYGTVCATQGLPKNGKSLQRDRLNDLRKEVRERVEGTMSNSEMLFNDYPFAVGLMEVMKMMDYYHSTEWNCVTPDAVKDRYVKLSKDFTAFVKTLGVSEIKHAGLKKLYLGVYVPFLMNTFNKTSIQLYSEGLLPFRDEVLLKKNEKE